MNPPEKKPETPPTAKGPPMIYTQGPNGPIMAGPPMILGGFPSQFDPSNLPDEVKAQLGAMGAVPGDPLPYMKPRLAAVGFAQIVIPPGEVGILSAMPQCLFKGKVLFLVASDRHFIISDISTGWQSPPPGEDVPKDRQSALLSDAPLLPNSALGSHGLMCELPPIEIGKSIEIVIKSTALQEIFVRGMYEGVAVQ